MRMRPTSRRRAAWRRLRDLDDAERRDLAEVLRDVVIRFDNLWRMPFPYVMALHQAPVKGDTSGFHFHIEFHPPLRRPNLLKYLAGPEIGGGNFLSDTSPEEKAAELVAAGGPHYRPSSRRDRSPTRFSRRCRRCTGASARTSSTACEQAAVTALAGVAADDEGDTIYAIDRVAEHVLSKKLARTIATPDAPVVLVAEGLPGGRSLVPAGARGPAALDDHRRPDRRDARASCTRSGRLDPDRRRRRDQARATLADIELAVQTEIPLVKQHLSDEFWAVRGQGASRPIRFNRLTGEDAAARAAALDARPRSRTALR